MADYLREMSNVPRFAAAAHRPARRRLWESEKHSPVVRLLIGDAIGDAFGFGIEMQDAYWIRKMVTHFDRWPHNPVLAARFRHNNVRGFYSDDAEMTAGLMKALVQHGAVADREQMLSAWHDEWELAKTRPPPAVRGGERQGHGGIGYVWRGDSSLEEMRAKQAARVDPGNAPPMRALPLGFVADPAVRERLALENADATHPHPKARAASLLVGFACRFLVVEGGSATELLRAAVAHLEGSPLAEPETIAHLRALDGLPDFHTYGTRYSGMPRDVHALLCGPQPCPFTTKVPAGADGRQPMEGLYTDSMRTLGCVLYILKHQTGPLDALTASIDLGGDVDSVRSRLESAAPSLPATHPRPDRSTHPRPDRSVPSHPIHRWRRSASASWAVPVNSTSASRGGSRGASSRSSRGSSISSQGPRPSRSGCRRSRRRHHRPHCCRHCRHCRHRRRRTSLTWGASEAYAFWSGQSFAQ